MRQRLTQWLLDRGGAVALAALVAYVATVPPHIVDGDNAEFAALGASGGAAHPSGYPLYVLWLRLWSWLPGSPAHAGGLATAVLGAAAILVLHAACRAWGARPAAASVAVAIVAAAPVVVRMHTQAEAFALNHLVVATVVWLARADVPSGRWRAALLGLVAGLGLANHLTCVLVAPIGIYGVVRAAGWRALPIALAGALVGLAPYVYLVIAPATPMSWGQVDGLGALVAHVLREDFGGASAFANTGVEVPASDNLAALARSLGRAWLVVLPVVGLAALGWKIARGADRIAWIVFAASWLLAGPLLVLRFDLPLTLLGTYVVERFHLLPALLLAVPIAVALSSVARRGSLVAYTAIALLVFGVLFVRTHVGLAAIQSRAMQTGCVNMLQAMPADAVWIIAADDLHFGTIYAQSVLGVRPDVTPVTWGMLGMPWYRARIAARGVALDLTPGPVAKSVRTAVLVLKSGRPVVIDDENPNIQKSLPTYPYAGNFRVLAPGTRLPPLDAIVDENKAAFARFDRDYVHPGPGDEYATVMHQRYAATWQLIAGALERAGRPEDAAAAAEVARQLAPR